VSEDWKDVSRDGRDDRARSNAAGRVESLRGGRLGNVRGDDHAHYVGQRDDPNARYARDPGGDVVYDDRWSASHARKLALVEEAEQLAHSSDWKSASAQQRELMTRWKAAGYAGPVTDGELWDAFRQARQTYYDRADRHFKDQDRARERARHEKEALVHAAEGICTSTDWKSAGDRLRELHGQWKSVGSAGREHEERLWRRFKAAGDEFHRRRVEHFAELERKLRANGGAKEQLVTSARRLRTHGDYKAAKGEFRDLMDQWKTIGHAGDREEALWRDFQAAKDALYDAAQAQWRERQWAYVQKVEQRIARHREVIANMESLRSDLMNRRHNVMPGRRELELIEHYDGRIREIEGVITERHGWLNEDVRKLQEAQSRL
jgi:hypothetical protein